MTVARLSYVGVDPQAPQDIANRLQATTVLTSGPVNRTATSSQVATTAQSYADKTSIDTADETFALPTYYQSQDELNIHNSTVGQPNGVAALDGTGKVPLAQMPVLGVGYVAGRYGPTSVTGGVAGSTPVKIAEFTPGVAGVPFQPMVFAVILATPAAGGRPVIEARISSGAATYINQTLVARAVGRSLFYDTQALAVKPCPSTAGQSPSSFPGPTDIVVSLWLFDLNGQSSTVHSGDFPSAGLYLLRVGQ